MEAEAWASNKGRGEWSLDFWGVYIVALGVASVKYMREAHCIYTAEMYRITRYPLNTDCLH